MHPISTIALEQAKWVLGKKSFFYVFANYLNRHSVTTLMMAGM